MRLIDADALIARCGSWYTEEGTEEGFIGTLKNILDLMPTIEPERKKGKWITKSTGGEMFDCCSVCGYVEWNEPKNFCPNCGAKMYGGDSDV